MTETRQATTTLRSISRDERTVDIIASTFDIDSYGTRIDQAGWDFEAFRKNPVICLQHDDRGYTGSNGLPIANAIPETIRVEGGKTYMRLRFPEQGKFPLADQVFDLIADGFMRGVSVGFEPTEYEDTTEIAPDGKEFTVRVYRKQRLLEVSIVTIPSNDNALVQRAKNLNADEAVVRRMTEQLETTLDEVAKVIDPVEFEKYRTYFEKKQPANREATRVMDRFFKRILKEEQPADEVQAWQRMGDAVDAMEEKVEVPVVPIEQKPEEPVIAPAEVNLVETPVEVTEPTPPNPQAVEAPQPERKASVQIPLSVLADFPSRMTKALTDAGIEALRRGIPIKDACKLIDGMNEAVGSSISHISHGSNA